MKQVLTPLQKSYYFLLLAFLSILSVSGTIALRNSLHLLLLIIVAWYCLHKLRTDSAMVTKPVKQIPLPVFLWCAYLLLFPLWAPDQEGALANLIGKGMWGESILTWILAWGSVLILGFGRLGLWPLALVSAVPVFIHLTLLILAWGGILQPAFYENPSLQEVGISLSQVLGGNASVSHAFEVFPMGFRGIEPMHGNLGYPASQAMCFGLAIAFSAWRKGVHTEVVKAMILIAMCFASVVIAQSRAAAYFGLFLVLISFLINWYVGKIGKSRLPDVGGMSAPRKSRILWVLLLSVVFGCSILFLKVISSNQAWSSMGGKMIIGLELTDPKAILCDGLSDEAKEAIRSRYADKSPEYVNSMIDGLEGDGGRVLLARAGAELVTQFPEGLNGGRDAYQIRMKQSCGHVPVMDFSHAHNAWINLILSIGWVGAAIFASVLLTFAYLGWHGFVRNNAQANGMVLLLLSIFWIFRGLVDAVYQEHYLQMQAFFLMMVYLSLWNQRNEK